MNGENAAWDWSHAFAALPEMLWSFLTVTLLVTLLGSAIAVVLGLVIALARHALPRPAAAVITLVMNVIRMTPLVVQLLFVYYAATSMPPLAIGIVVFGVHYATFMAEVYRAGIDSIPRAQWEAATALSLPRRRTWFAVVIPQALRATAPALGNYVISMFKETPFLAVITVTDMVRAAQLYGGEHFRYIEVITLAGLLFLVASYPTSLLIGRLEKRLGYAS